MPSERIRIGDDYYLLASALAPRGRRLLLNHGDSFAIFDEAGDIPLAGIQTYGLFCRGTRFLDRLELRLNGEFPLLLSAAPTDDGSELVSYLSNPDERRGREVVVLRDTVAVHRDKTLADGALFERLQLHNYGSTAMTVRLTVCFRADFADIFELRGVERRQRGGYAPATIEGDCVRLSYCGLDEVRREVQLRFAPSDWHLEDGRAELVLELAPGRTARAEIAIRCRSSDEPSEPLDRFDDALAVVREERRECSELFPVVYTDNEGFNDWLNGSLRDLALLRIVLPTGSYLTAGIPWFATVFGRDGLLTSLETLAFAPELAAGTLRTLAALQGRESDPQRDEEPGKILHELRHGEMAATGEVPFGRYYGSVDATPLFLALLASYAERTDDLGLVEELWPAALAALAWVDAHLDRRGYLTYARRTPRGLINQGWKDSHDSIAHADGRLAEPPIALCEVQGYLYAARRGLALLARRRGQLAQADEWDNQAAELQVRFGRDFWMADEETYALALDADGQPCRVVTSNAGHCLLAGIADAASAARVVSRLMRDDCFCGWGVRTLSDKARRYNPMSYHNGSVWPHDNALIAAGFSRYGFNARAGELLTALFDASLGMEDRRLPELFCGFARAQRHQPVPYPVACKPQAWAAGSVFLLLQATLGLRVDAWKRRVSFSQPALPGWMNTLEIRGLRVVGARLDLRITRGRRSAAVEVTGKEGEVDVLVRK
jgi:glycogen debranching enzyme